MSVQPTKLSLVISWFRSKAESRRSAAPEQAPERPWLNRNRRQSKQALPLAGDDLTYQDLSFGRQLADRHVVDHSSAQRTNGLVGHEGAAFLGGVGGPSISDRTLHPAS